MAIFSVDTIFIHIPKTAGSSMTKAMRGVKKCDTHAHASLIKDNFPGQFNDAFKFSIIRNPWDRLFSMYKFRTKRDGRDISFVDWFHQDFNRTDIEKEQTPPGETVIPNLQKPQMNWLKDPETGEILVDYICLFEELWTCCRTIEDMSRLKLSDKLPHIQQSPSKAHYKDVYDVETKELVEYYFKEDIDVGQYRF